MRPQTEQVRASPARAARKAATAYWPHAFAFLAGLAAFLYLLIWGQRYGLDLRVYRAAVKYWGSAGNPYSRRFTRHRLPFTYPPFALVVLLPLARASFRVAQWLLWVSSIAAAASCIALFLRDRGSKVTPVLWYEAAGWSCLLAGILEPARSAVDYGQIEFILMFLVVADVLLIPSPYRGLATGFAVAIKLTPLVFLIAFIVMRDVKSVARAALSFLSLTALSWLLWPALSRAYWLHDAINPVRDGRIAYDGNQSWYAVLHRPPFPATGSPLAWLLLAVLTLTAASIAAWHNVQAGQKALAVEIIALAGLLVSPVSWTHHWVWVLLIPPVLVRQCSTDIPRLIRILLWALVILTIAAPYWWFKNNAAADICNAMLPLCAFSILAVWAALSMPRIGQRFREPRRRARVPGQPATQLALRIRRGPGLD